MFDVLNGLRVVEVASFIAAPIAGLHLAQLGAEVIRVDPIRNGHDHDRWPLAEDGTSLYWEGLNKGKTTIAVDLTQDDGKNLVRDLIAETGILLTNYPPNSFLNHAALAARRQDQITLSVMGWADGRTAVDYTVNAAMGLPYMTGPAECDGPVNHVLPAWDLISG
ncbi:MAG: CoA transferase, partial [Pseudooceanicola atlanticus]